MEPRRYRAARPLTRILRLAELPPAFGLCLYCRFKRSSIMRKLLSLLFLTTAVSLAYTPVQVGPNTCHFNPGMPGSGPLTCAFTSNVGANNVLVIGVHARIAGATGVTSIT